ncbi:unnamed protein product [Amaranthus hypochondriacus]
MGFSPFILLIFFTILKLSKSAPDYTTLVYKGCAKQPLSDPNGLFSQSLSALFSSLIQQSSRSKYYKTTSGGSQSTISGLFQCRGDLSYADCYNCVSKLPQLSDQLCGKVSSARVQLLGCYMVYEVSGSTQISGLQMLFKACSATNVAGSGFEMRRDSALTLMENGIGNGKSNGFYTTNYEGVYVMGQCQGDLSTTDCAQCIKAAVQKSQIECGSSLSGQVYLYKCFITYNYYPNGVPTKSSSYSSGGYSGGSGQTTGKTVAIIVGVTAGVGFLIILVLFLRGLKKKKDDDY